MSTGTKGVPRAARESQILDIAAAEFGTRGYANASMNAVATQAGISKPLIYGYFGSKDGLYLACLHRAGKGLVEAVGSAQTELTAQRAVDTLEAIFRVLADRPHDWSVLYDPTLPLDSAVHEAARGYRRTLAEFGATGTAAVLRDADPDDQSLLTSIWFSAVSATVRWWHDHPDETPESMTARCARILRALTSGSSHAGI